MEEAADGTNGMGRRDDPRLGELRIELRRRETIDVNKTAESPPKAPLITVSQGPDYIVVPYIVAPTLAAVHDLARAAELGNFAACVDTTLALARYGCAMDLGATNFGVSEISECLSVSARR